MGEVVLPSVVYIVDDDVSFQAAIRRRLQLAGYEVQIYSSAEQFLDQQPNDNNRSGCLLLEVRIPGLSGPELQGRLHEAGSTLPIVFVSGYENIQTTVQTVKAGAAGFRPGGSRQDQQTDCVCTGPDRTDDQGAPTYGHGENGRTVVGRAGPDR